MKTRKARLIRAGILAARDPELAQYAHLGHRIVREACRREAVKMAAARLHPNARCANPSQGRASYSLPPFTPEFVAVDPRHVTITYADATTGQPLIQDEHGCMRPADDKEPNV